MKHSRHHGAIGLALGSGGARGWAHIGVINAIRELGIEVRCVAGTSMGALVGAAYAAGTLDTLQRVALDLDWKHSWRYFMGLSRPHLGLIDGARIVDFIAEHVSPANIEDLPMPYAAVATDIMSGEEVVIRQGGVMDAVRASIAIPGLFTPCQRDGRMLVDGGLVNPLPVSVAQALGAERIIAVDITRAPVTVRPQVHQSQAKNGAELQPDDEVVRPPDDSDAIALLNRMNRKLHRAARVGLSGFFGRRLSRGGVPAVFDVIGNSMRIFQRQITAMRLKLEPADILIQPDVQAISTMEFPRAAEAIEAGYRAAMQVLTAESRRSPAEGEQAMCEG